ncbi:MAG: hypothetical protein AB7R90_02720 [Reyranellaceae bacterium]
MNPPTKPGPGEAPHEKWRNRDYGETAEATPSRRRRLQIVAALLSVLMLLGLLWNMLKPLAD